MFSLFKNLNGFLVLTQHAVGLAQVLHHGELSLFTQATVAATKLLEYDLAVAHGIAVITRL